MGGNGSLVHRPTRDDHMLISASWECYVHHADETCCMYKLFFLSNPQIVNLQTLVFSSRTGMICCNLNNMLYFYISLSSKPSNVHPKAQPGMVASHIIDNKVKLHCHAAASSQASMAAAYVIRSCCTSQT